MITIWNRRLLTIAAASMITLTSQAHAQRSQSAARFGIDAGVTAPISDYSNDKHVGYHLGILVDVRVPETPLGLRVDGAFHELKYAGSSTRAQIFAATTSAMVKVPTGTFVTPYLIGGAGVYNSQRTLFLAGARSHTDFGVNLGAGLRFDLVDVTTFVEARYHRAGGDVGPRIVPITLGVLF